MNSQNQNLVEKKINSKKIKPGGILKKTPRNNNTYENENNLKLKNQNSVDTLNLNETANTVE